jgi:hypothetical protein
MKDIGLRAKNLITGACPGIEIHITLSDCDLKEYAVEVWKLVMEESPRPAGWSSLPLILSRELEKVACEKVKEEEDVFWAELGEPDSLS